MKDYFIRISVSKEELNMIRSLADRVNRSVNETVMDSVRLYAEIVMQNLNR